MSKLKISALALAITSGLLAGCNGNSDSSNAPTTKQPTSSKATVLDVDASQGAKTTVDLYSNAIVTDDTWQVAYQKYVGFSTNGGVSGNGKISACAAHNYSDIFDSDSKPVESEFKKLTITSTLQDFEKVNLSNCNDSDFITDNIKTQIKTEDWLNADYSTGAPVFTAKAGNGWIIRTDSGSDYARVSVKSVTVVFGASPSRKLVFTTELWDSNAKNFQTGVDKEIDFTNEQVFFDANTNAIVTENDNWDLSVKVEGRDYPIQVNGGVSGSGKAAVGTLTVANAAAVTDPESTGSTEQVYRYYSDLASGALTKPGNYGPLQYNVGGKHQMCTNFYYLYC